MAEAGPPTDTDLSRSLLMGSEVEYDHTCHPCSSAGRHVEAEGYCRDCGVHLCAVCINCHKTLPVLAHHQLMDKHSMPQTQGTPVVKDACTERCDTHKDEVIKYYCPVHKILGCTACITLNHKKCDDVAYIPEAAAGLEDSEDFKVFQKKLKALIKTSKDAIQLSQDRLERATDNYTRVLQEVEAYQQELNSTLDKLKIDIKGKLGQIKSKNTGKLNGATADGKNVLAELEAVSQNIQTHLSKKHYNKLFVQMKHTEEKLKQLEERLKEINKTGVALYEFKKNLELQKMTERKPGLGELVRRPENAKVNQVIDINVDTDSNKTTCWIEGAALLCTKRLVLTDYNNNTVKLLDIDNGKIMSELSLNTSPWDVTTVDSEHVALTEPTAKKITLLRYDKRVGMVVDYEIKTNAKCFGIDYVPDKLVVSLHNPTEVRILAMNGDVLQTFATDGQGNMLFKDPVNIAVNTSTQSIYVSDCGQNSVIMLDMSGKVKAFYKDDGLRKPRGLAVDHMGRVYVCDRESNNIHLLTGDCQKMKVLCQADGLRNPVGLSYCVETRRLYMGMQESNVIKVYPLL